MYDIAVAAKCNTAVVTSWCRLHLAIFNSTTGFDSLVCICMYFAVIPFKKPSAAPNPNYCPLVWPMIRVL